MTVSKNASAACVVPDVPADPPEPVSRAVTIWIWLAFALTFAAVVVMSQTPLSVEIEEWADEVRGKGGRGPEAVAKEIAGNIRASPPARRQQLAAEAASEQPPDVLLALSRRLSMDNETAPLAVAILGMGAEHYQHAEIMIQAAREYSVGRLVDKDYPKAIRLYSDPLVFRLPGVKYYLAEIYLAEDNPNRDPDRGLELLREAAAGGHAKASARLRELAGTASPQHKS